MTAIKCDSNRDLKNFLWQISKGKVLLNENWVCINKGIYIRLFDDDRRENEYFQIAVDKSRFDNKLLLEHSLKLLDRFMTDILGYDVSGDWNAGNGSTLDIKGKGDSTRFAWREVVV